MKRTKFAIVKFCRQNAGKKIDKAGNTEELLTLFPEGWEGYPADREWHKAVQTPAFPVAKQPIVVVTRI